MALGVALSRQARPWQPAQRVLERQPARVVARLRRRTARQQHACRAELAVRNGEM